LQATHDGPELDDLVAAGMAGLAKAITRHKTGRLYAFAKLYIEGAISAVARNHKKGATSGETRLDRFVYSRPHDKPEWIVFALKRPGIRWTPEAAAAALAELDAAALVEKVTAGTATYLREKKHRALLHN
jgi:hypothetical protein